MGQFVQISRDERAYLIHPWADSLPAQAELPAIDLGEGGGPGRALRALQRGAWPIASGAWRDVEALLEAVAARPSELGGGRARPGRPSRRGPDPAREAQRRVLVAASADGWLDTRPPIHLPHLLELLGEPRGASAGLPVLAPATAIAELMATLDERYPVRALGAELVAPKMVLQPRQQEVYDLFEAKLLDLRDVEMRYIASLPARQDASLRALDMGCGSGALALQMAQLLAPLGPTVWATDVLPEALATARLNIDRLSAQGVVRGELLRVTDGGDLYEPLGELAFDLIAFNPPWANARPRTRLEVARYDFGQATLRRFLEATPAHLRPGGRLLLFYADNAGPKALEGARAAAEAAGLRIADATSRRIRVARRWEHIWLYEMGRS